MIFQSTLLQEERLSLFKHIEPFFDFNPRSYKRSDIISLRVVIRHRLFQSTLLQEERPALVCGFFWSLRFQSTLLQEERLSSSDFANVFDYFNPRSYKRSDVQDCCGRITHRNFNPRSYKRSDLSGITEKNCRNYFNPRSYKRSDQCTPLRKIDKNDFNPRSYKRSDNRSNNYSKLHT